MPINAKAIVYIALAVWIGVMASIATVRVFGAPVEPAEQSQH